MILYELRVSSIVSDIVIVIRFLQIISFRTRIYLLNLLIPFYDLGLLDFNISVLLLDGRLLLSFQGTFGVRREFGLTQRECSRNLCICVLLQSLDLLDRRAHNLVVDRAQGFVVFRI